MLDYYLVNNVVGWMHSWGVGAEQVHAHINDPNPFSSGAFRLDAHNEKVNLSFTDGHVEQMEANGDTMFEDAEDPDADDFTGSIWDARK